MELIHTRERKILEYDDHSKAQCELNEQIKSLGLRIAVPFSEVEFNKSRVELSKPVRCNNDRIAELRTQIEMCQGDALKNARVIGCTLTKVMRDTKISSEKFDVMILDEASMAPLPAVFFAAGQVDVDHYIVSGDFRQLPPIAKSKGEAAKRWLHRDIFTQAGVVQAANSSTPDERLVMLKEQHRMHPDIVQVINKPMYAGQLGTSEYARQEKPKITAHPPFEDHALVCVDTSRINPWCKQPPLGSRINLYTAFLAARLAKMIIEGGTKNVGIITPYNAQAKLIASMLESEQLSPEQVMAATVHKFQGNERQCIILDLVDGPPLSAGLPNSGAFPESNAAKLINVAVSRAEGKLIVITNTRYIQTEFRKSDAVAEVIQEIQQTGVVIDATEIVSSYLDLSEEERRFDPKGRTLPTNVGTTILNETTFYPVFIEDLKRAKERVVIFSPFITQRRMSTLMDTFRSLADSGVKVFLITRDPSRNEHDMDDANLIEMIRKAGIDVILPSQKVGLHNSFHEKVALIDNEVIYFGSLNILSQNDSSESMIAYRSPEIILELVKNFDIDGITRKYERSLSTRNKTYRKESSSSISTPPGSSIEPKRKERPGQSAKRSGERPKPSKDITKQTDSVLSRIEKGILSSAMAVQRCPACKSLLRLEVTENGLAFKCPNAASKGCTVFETVPESYVKAVVDKLAIPCEKCGNGKLKYRISKIGPFLGCSQYPACRSIKNIR